MSFYLTASMVVTIAPVQIASPTMIVSMQQFMHHCMIDILLAVQLIVAYRHLQKKSLKLLKLLRSCLGAGKLLCKEGHQLQAYPLAIRRETAPNRSSAIISFHKVSPNLAACLQKWMVGQTSLTLVNSNTDHQSDLSWLLKMRYTYVYLDIIFKLQTSTCRLCSPPDHQGWWMYMSTNDGEFENRQHSRA